MHIDRAAAACTFSAPIRSVVATSGGPLVQGRNKTESRTSVKVLMQASKLGEWWLGVAGVGVLRCCYL
jgi:hypothetical protein